MSVVTTNAYSGPFTGNGATVAFPFTFSSGDDDEIIVYADLVETSGYTVTRNSDGNGGTVTFDVAPANGVEIFIASDPSFTQTVSFENAGAFLPETHDQVIDQLTRQNIYLLGLLQRAIIGPLGEGAMAALPSAANRAGGYLAFDVNGDPVAASGSGADGALRVDLATAGGADLVGVSIGGSVEDWVSKLGNQSLGALASGTVIPLEMTKTFTVNADGLTDFRGFLMQARMEGAHNAYQVNAYHGQTEIRHTAGSLSFARAFEGYTRLGLSGSSNGDIASARVFEGHIANESLDGDITSAMVFYANQVDLGDGAGLIATMTAFHAGDQGHASRVSVAARGFHCGNFTAGAPRNTAFSSEMSYGAGRWGFHLTGGASSWTAGRVRIGGAEPSDLLAGQPTDFLEVVGGIRAHTYLGTIAAIGYGVSAGGSVTQATSKSTAVTLNKPCGKITMHNAALAANTIIGFNLNNDQIEATDVIDVTISGGVGAGGSYLAWVDAVNNGSCRIILWNRTAGSLGEAVALNFAIFKAEIS